MENRHRDRHHRNPTQKFYGVCAAGYGLLCDGQESWPHRAHPVRAGLGHEHGVDPSQLFHVHKFLLRVSCRGGQ